MSLGKNQHLRDCFKSSLMYFLPAYLWKTLMCNYSLRFPGTSIFWRKMISKRTLWPWILSVFSGQVAVSAWACGNASINIFVHQSFSIWKISMKKIYLPWGWWEWVHICKINHDKNNQNNQKTRKSKPNSLWWILPTNPLHFVNKSLLLPAFRYREAQRQSNYLTNHKSSGRIKDCTLRSKSNP